MLPIPTLTSSIPGLQDILNANRATGFTSFGDIISQALELTFAVVAMVAFFYGVWGVYQYIFAGGDKEGLGKARARITWAIVGLVIMGMGFAISRFVEDFLVTQEVEVTNVEEPPPIKEIQP